MFRAGLAGCAAAAAAVFIRNIKGGRGAAIPLHSALEAALRLLKPFLRPYRERRRKREIAEEIPDFLRRVSFCLRASLTVRQALQECARTAAGPLGEELKRTHREIESGVDFRQAMNHLAAKAENRELAMTATVLAAGARYGGDIAGAAASLSSIAARRLALKRETDVLTAQARLSGLILATLPVAFFILFPGADGRGPIGALADPIGWIIVLAGLALDAGGYAVMRRLADPDRL